MAGAASGQRGCRRREGGQDLSLLPTYFWEQQSWASLAEHALLRLFLLRFSRFEHLLQKAGLGHRSHNLDAVVHHRLGDALHPIALGQVNELGDFDHIGGDVLVFDSKLVGQPGHTGAVGSGRGDEDLDVQVLIDRR